MGGVFLFWVGWWRFWGGRSTKKRGFFHAGGAAGWFSRQKQDIRSIVLPLRTEALAEPSGGHENTPGAPFALGLFRRMNAGVRINAASHGPFPGHLPPAVPRRWPPPAAVSTPGTSPSPRRPAWRGRGFTPASSPSPRTWDKQTSSSPTQEFRRRTSLSPPLPQ